MKIWNSFTLSLILYAIKPDLVGTRGWIAYWVCFVMFVILDELLDLWGNQY